jgi:hypothetical protein
LRKARGKKAIFVAQDSSPEIMYYNMLSSGELSYEKDYEMGNEM